jgi:hypothetical protein
MNKSEFVAAMKRRITPVTIDGFGQIYVRSLSGVMRARVADSYRDSDGQSIEDAHKRVQCYIVAHVLVDENGDRIFGDEDIDVISNLDAGVLDQISQAGIAASGMGVKSVEQAEKNSETIPSEPLPIN